MVSALCFVFSGYRLFAIDGAHLLQTNKVFSILNDSRGDIYNNTSVWRYLDPAWPEASSVNIFKYFLKLYITEQFAFF